MINRLLVLGLILVMGICKSNSQQVKSEDPNLTKTSETVETKKEETKELSFKDANGTVFNKVIKSSEQWAEELDKQEYYVIREKGTERSFTSDLLQNKSVGVYTCAACDLPLFDSDTKFKSGTGWPSFYQPIDEAYILEDTDYVLGYARTEVMCNRCEGHLGHVFSDGPEPTGLRYCINGVSLNFESTSSKKK